jgi:uncharacterized protein (DUF1499 family)
MLLRILGWGTLGLLGMGLAGTIALAVAAQLAPQPEGLGVREGRLAPCPPTPNCVSTQADPADTVHFIVPVPLSAPASEAQARLHELLQAQPRTTILREAPGYIHALFRSPTMGFPDDVEFWLDESAGLLQFRSAARMGRGDMGANRARLERLRPELQRVATRP